MIKFLEITSSYLCNHAAVARIVYLSIIIVNWALAGRVFGLSLLVFGAALHLLLNFMSWWCVREIATWAKIRNGELDFRMSPHDRTHDQDGRIHLKDLLTGLAGVMEELGVFRAAFAVLVVLHFIGTTLVHEYIFLEWLVLADTTPSAQYISARLGRLMIVSIGIYTLIVMKSLTLADDEYKVITRREFEPEIIGASSDESSEGKSEEKSAVSLAGDRGGASSPRGEKRMPRPRVRQYPATITEDNHDGTSLDRKARELEKELGVAKPTSNAARSTTQTPVVVKKRGRFEEAKDDTIGAMTAPKGGYKNIFKRKRDLAKRAKQTASKYSKDS